MTDTKKIATNDGESPLVGYLHSKGRRLGVSVSVTFELTSRCNFNCKMCYVHDKNACSDGELSAKEWLSLGEQAKNAGALFLLLTGGEPLIRSDFAEIYTGLKKMGFIISINTNGSLITGKIAELFEKDPPSRLNVSLYGVTNETYERLTGVPAFNTVATNIQKMRAVGIDCRLNCSLTPENACDVGGIYAFAKENNLFIKGTSYMYPPVRRDKFTTGKNDCRFSADETAFYRKEINRLNLPPEKFAEKCERILKNGSEIMRECDEEAQEGTPLLCRAGSSSCWINKNGLMSACGLFATNKFDTRVLGFDAAWQKVRETTAKIRLSPKCASCGKKSLCGVCAASAYAETGRFDGTPEYLCEVADKLYGYLTEETEKTENENK